jgi:hypothetical protein
MVAIGQLGGDMDDIFAARLHLGQRLGKAGDHALHLGGDVVGLSKTVPFDRRRHS